MVVADAMHFSKSRYINPIVASEAYCSVIEKIWEAIYTTFRVPIFKCKWVDTNTGVKTNDLGIVTVNFNKVGYKDEPFVMAFQRKQVFFIKGPYVGYGQEPLSVVLIGKRMHKASSAENKESTLDISETPSISIQMPTFTEENESTLFMLPVMIMTKGLYWRS